MATSPIRAAGTKLWNEAQTVSTASYHRNEEPWTYPETKDSPCPVNIKATYVASLEPIPERYVCDFNSYCWNNTGKIKVLYFLDKKFTFKIHFPSSS